MTLSTSHKNWLAGWKNINRILISHQNKSQKAKSFSGIIEAIKVPDENMDEYVYILQRKYLSKHDSKARNCKGKDW